MSQKEAYIASFVAKCWSAGNAVLRSAFKFFSIFLPVMSYLGFSILNIFLNKMPFKKRGGENL